MKTAEHRNGENASLAYARSSNGLLLAQRLVRAGCVVVADELDHDAAKVIFVQNENVIENLSPERAREAFSKRVHVGARTAVRTSRAPDEMRTPAKPLPSSLS
jgi:hypothetical protein